jgi:peptidoglycan/xylan/chitin deacetylase (PgdA/CDA1 family)
MRDVLVLCYHGVSTTWPAPTAVTPDHLEDHVSALVRLGYRGATFRQALTTPTDRKTVVLTFDDALRSVLERAFPILSRLGVPATVFVPTAHTDGAQRAAWPGHDVWVGTPHERELECMTWDELRHLAQAGWEVGSHTRSHPRLTQIDDRALRGELIGSKEDCEDQLGQRCDSLAYPYSDYDDRVVRATREAGYLFAATVALGPRPPLPLQWPRVGAYRGERAWRLLLRAHARRSRPSSAMATMLRMRQLSRRFTTPRSREDYVRGTRAP